MSLAAECKKISVSEVFPSKAFEYTTQYDSSVLLAWIMNGFFSINLMTPVAPFTNKV